MYPWFEWFFNAPTLDFAINNGDHVGHKTKWLIQRSAFLMDMLIGYSLYGVSLLTLNFR